MEYITFKEALNGKGFISYDMRDILKELNLKDDDLIVNFAYTDYGGDFFDKVAIEFFSNNQYKNCFIWEHTSYFGKNAVLFGSIVKEFKEVTENYLLCFEGIEDLYYTMEGIEEQEGFNSFLNDCKNKYNFNNDDCLEWLYTERSGHFSIYPAGIDFCYSTLENDMIKAGLLTKKED